MGGVSSRLERRELRHADVRAAKRQQNQVLPRLGALHRALWRRRRRVIDHLPVRQLPPARLDVHWRGVLQPKKRIISFLNFPYGCPEPVLAK